MDFMQMVLNIQKNGLINNKKNKKNCMSYYVNYSFTFLNSGNPCLKIRWQSKNYAHSILRMPLHFS